ncbi:MAG: 50S ribosomal protein L11 methyltransferase, partial [Myxococcales bacterium]|nr:50S ribosomal protein L11 methyltransferase [Myxococcales bacterium]
MATDGARRRFVLEHTALAAPPLVPEIELHLAAEVDPLWHATQAWLDDHDLPPPFWAFAWPGGIALARLILDGVIDVRGRSVVDLASGSGLVAIAAARAGAARVRAVDLDPFATAATIENAARSGVVV